MRVDEAKKAELSAQIGLDLRWQRQRENFLDWGREPRFSTLADVVVTSLFFLFVWAAAVWLGRPEWIVGAAGIAIAVLFSFRARGFDQAYRAYLRERGQPSTILATR